MKEKKIQWHPAFAAALEMEFAQDRVHLEFEREYNLNRKPLLIDALIIKKKKDVILKNEIGKLFNKYNVIEYKSMKASLSIDDVSKAQGYAHLLKSYGRSVDEVKFEDVTVTLMREAKPVSLFQYFAENGYRVSAPYSGIYYVGSGLKFPTQIVVGKELGRENHEWLSLLSNRVTRQEMEKAIRYSGMVSDKGEKELIDAILEVTVAANETIVKELMGDEHMCEALMEMMEPKIREREQKVRQASIEQGIEQGIAIGANNTARETAERLIRTGKLPLEDIADCTGLPFETVKQLESGILQSV